MKRVVGRIAMSAGLFFLSAALLMSTLTHVHADNQDVTDTGTALQFVLPGLALGSTFFAGNPEGGLWDREGTRQALLSIGSTAGFVAVGKGLARKMRPDGSDRNSFPSGHTAASFSGASFIGTRYGWQWGIPAYAAAAFVGYSRYQANQHYSDDILAGASLAMLNNWVWVRPMHERFTLLPVVADNAVGIQLVGVMDANPKAKADAGTQSSAYPPTKYRFHFQFGPGYVTENKVNSEGGTTFDLKDLQENDYPLTTSHLTVEATFGERHTLSVSIWPMETKDRGTLDHPVAYLGKTFPADTPIATDWILFDTRVDYLYNFTPSSPLILMAGPGIMLQYHEVKLQTQDQTIRAEEDDVVLLPFLSAKLGWRFTDKLSFFVKSDGGYLADAWMVDAKAVMNYKLNRSWDFSVGYEHYVRDIEGSQVQNRITQNLPYLSVAYSW